jgi:hypothetical protein
MIAAKSQKGNSRSHSPRNITELLLPLHRFDAIPHEIGDKILRRTSDAPARIWGLQEENTRVGENVNSTGAEFGGGRAPWS